MPTRLPSRRPNVTREATIASTKVFLTLGFHEDGRIGELFIDVAPGDADETIRAWAGCWARAISLGLRYGVPVETVVEHFRFSEFAPQGAVRPPDPIHFAKSIVDWVVAVIEAEAGLNG